MDGKEVDVADDGNTADGAIANSDETCSVVANSTENGAGAAKKSQCGTNFSDDERMALAKAWIRRSGMTTGQNELAFWSGVQEEYRKIYLTNRSVNSLKKMVLLEPEFAKIHQSFENH